jgi:ABC-type antimicrobial peptide transport system permease subunit
MNLTDIIALSLRNLRQAKLRTALTVLGVVIGVAAIITMVSFGIGLQQNILANAFAKLDLFTVVQVFGPSADELLSLGGGNPDTSAAIARRDAPPATTPSPETSGSDGSSSDSKNSRDRRKRVLDDRAIAEMEKIEGVRYAIPVLMFQCYVRFGERTARYRVGGALASTEFNPRFRKFLAGQAFSSDSVYEVVVTEGFLTRFAGGDRRRRGGGPFGQSAMSDKSEAERTADAQAAIGKQIELLTLPSGQTQASVFGIPLSMISEDEGPEGSFVKSEFRIVGVLATETGVNFDQFARTDIYVPVELARAFRDANRDPLERMGEALVGDTGYSRAEVRVMDPSRVREVQQQITKLGFNSFSLTNQIDEIRYVFLVVNGALALLGGIALLVASFGIANTMIMSILERTREIGIMKAIGGSDSEIMRIFFFEASLIGLVGGIAGVISGWGVDRIANYLVNKRVVKQAPWIEFFSIPWYLAASAIAFAVLVSLIAAIYPAMRAARVDPIKALRHD